jgi:hypothetical protein
MRLPFARVIYVRVLHCITMLRRCYRCNIYFVVVHTIRQRRCMFDQHLSIGRIKLFNFERPLDRFALERRFPASAFGAQIRAPARALARRIDRNPTFQQAYQPCQAAFCIDFAARNARSLRNMPGPHSLLLCHINAPCFWLGQTLCIIPARKPSALSRQLKICSLIANS